ncbi:DNA-packaging protein [Rhizobium sp. Root482]|uniref:DNA-packaging protein n=1 Tax=Rhizobium sp. Root482 TaxID=1736543 RepID=UPI001FCE18A6|nr:terminase family protein [Rhizobium sp. Root482]
MEAKGEIEAFRDTEMDWLLDAHSKTQLLLKQVGASLHGDDRVSTSTMEDFDKGSEVPVQGCESGTSPNVSAGNRAPQVSGSVIGAEGAGLVGRHQDASVPSGDAEAIRKDGAARLSRLLGTWSNTRRLEQRPPEGDWRVWLLMGGRGSGKTRAGAEWVQELAAGKGARPGLRIALVAETLGDAREVMIDGVSGICRIARFNRPVFEASRRRLVWPNGTVAQIFSSEDPESLRGPQFDYAWCDELAKWKHGQETFDMLQFALRLGEAPRALVTTTPRPVPVLKALIADPGTVVRRIRTGDNAGNLSPGFLDQMAQRYGGTRLGRQELDGEMIEDRDDALWSRAAIEGLKLRDAGPLGRIAVAVDPPSGSGGQSCCGIIVAGLDRMGRGVVLADCSVEGASPAGWASAVVRAYRRFDADRIVAEVNQGGDMVSAVLKGIDAQLPITSVRASRGKWLRAEPVAALYEQGRVVHAGSFPALEDQMCDFGPDGLSSGRSPDRLDALVWALTALMLDGGGEPRVRGI